MGKLTLTAGLCLVIASLASASSHHSSHSMRLVCHYNLKAKDRLTYGKVTVADINANLCTHLILASADINALYKMTYHHASDEQHYSSFCALKSRNPKLKTLLEVGVMNFNPQQLYIMLSSQQLRAILIQSGITLLRYHGFDGLNIDWTHPTIAGKTTFTLLLKELKEAFVAEAIQTGRDRLLLTSSLSAVKATIDASYDVPKISMYLDFINVFTFDLLDSSGTVTRHHSPLFQGSQDTGDKIFANTHFAMKYWQHNGAPPQKLNLGISLHGRSFELSSSATGVGAPISGPGEQGSYTNKDGFLAYYEICQFLSGATTHFIIDQKVPYATKGNQWVGYDNKISLTHKVSYIKTNHIGGIFVFSLDLDDFNGHFCGHGKYPIISHLHSLLVPGFPNLCAGKANGLYPHPYHPSYYYNCWNGAGHLQKCPGNLVFRQYCQCCDYPTTKPPVNPCYGKLYGLVPNPYDKHSFYNCGHGTAHLQHCPSNLVFKTSCQCCDYHATTHNGNPCHGKTHGNVPNPYNKYSYYKCINGKPHLLLCPAHTVFTTSCVYPTSGGNPCYGKPSGYYHNPYNARSYYHCYNGKAHLKYCYGNLVYKQSCRCCAHHTSTITVKSCYGHISGLFPYAKDNHFFYHCSNGIAYLKRCPANLIFKPSCHCCDYPTSTPTHPCHGAVSGYYAHSKDPHCFYKCASGIAYFLRCPTNYIYQHSSHSCVYAITGHTGNPCYGKLSGYFPFPHNPQYYFNCAHGIGYLQKCAPNLVFKASCTCCDFPSNPNPAICYGKASGLFPNPTNPYSFYHCDHGKAHLKYCPAKLVFQTSCSCCNWPQGTHTGICYGKPNGLYPSTYSPNYYYNCWNGAGHLQKCPGNLVFRQYCQCCDYPTTTSPVNPCYGKVYGLVPNPYDRHSFYNCGHGTAHLQHCPSNLVFKTSCQCCDYYLTHYNGNPCYGKLYGLYPNPNNQYSYYKCIAGKPHLLLCPAHTVFTTSCVYPTSPGNPCYGKPSGYYHNPHNAHSYYHCDNGQTHLKYCNGNLVYKQSCRCCAHHTTTPTGHICYGKSGLFPYAKDNHFFYHCSNGIAYLKRCAANLIFKSSCNCCDYPTSTPTYPCHGGSGYYSHPHHSHSFYHCFGGISHLLHCPQHYVYKHSKHCCVHSGATP